LVALGLVVTVLIALAALASRSSSVPSDGDQASAGPVIAIVHLIEIVGLAVELLVLLLLVLVFRTSRRRRKDDEDQIYHEDPEIPWVVKVLIVAFPLLVLAGVMYALYRFMSKVQSESVPNALAPPPPLPAGNGFAEQVGASLGLGWWELLIAVTLAGVAFVAIIRAFRTPPPTLRAEPDASPVQALTTAVRAGLRDARLEPDPRRAVIVAYASMEEILAAQGYPRRAVEAPLEYLARLFAVLNVSGEAMRSLTELFELARFSDHAISPATKAQAIAALAVIEEELQATP
jgi:heme/copper-type cytochrome/quinol oxidase subunit 2